MCKTCVITNNLHYFPNNGKARVDGRNLLSKRKERWGNTAASTAQ